VAKVALEREDARAPGASDSRPVLRRARAHLPRVRGWLPLLGCLRVRAAEDELALVAAGVAFYALLALFPAAAAVAALYGVLADAGSVNELLAWLPALPLQAHAVLDTELSRIATSSTPLLSAGALLALFVALLSAQQGVDAMLAALHIACDGLERHGFLRRTFRSLGLTLGAIAAAVVALALIAVLPVVLNALHVGPELRSLLALAPWPVLVAGFLAAVSLLYRFGCGRDRRRWLTPGAVVAAVLWVAASLAFAFYTGSFSGFGRTYGSVGALVVLLLWLWLTAYAVLLGAELDAELERQASLREPAQPRSGAAAQRAGAMREVDPPSRDVARTVQNSISAGDDLRRTR
jgi:membrane protein